MHKYAIDNRGEDDLRGMIKVFAEIIGMSYDELIEFTGSLYNSLYKQQESMFNYTLDQIKKYEQIAVNKKKIGEKVKLL